MIEYKCDAWGNHAVVDSNGEDIESGIGVLNPFRYRGYYYDTETELYYLQTRYYDPEVGRFISRDSIEYADPETINGLNLYAYCGNNPVMGYDPTGTTDLWEWVLGAIIVVGLVAGAIFTGGAVAAVFAGAAIGGAISYCTQLYSGELNWAQFALDIGVGALTGAIGASGISALGSTLIGASIGGVSNIGSQLISGKSFKDINWLSVGISAAIGALSGFLGGAGASNNENLARLWLNNKYNNLMAHIIAFIKNDSKLVLTYMHNAFVGAMKWYAAGTIFNNIIIGGLFD